MWKPEILSLVEDAERVREQDASLDLDVRALAQPPGGAGKIAEPVDRDDDGFFERRNMECRRQMGEVMLDGVKPCRRSADQESPWRVARGAPRAAPGW
jgi:hypothetical protein